MEDWVGQQLRKRRLSIDPEHPALPFLPPLTSRLATECGRLGTGSWHFLGEG
jgi:hypothetical protein